MTESHSVRPEWIAHTQLLLDSYHRHLGTDLIPRDGSAEEQAQRLLQAPFVVVSHGTQSDPVLNYGNQTALSLWEMDVETFTQTPSRYTAEPVHRDERARLLARTTEFGYVDDYSGIRISSSGKRFLIEQAIVWNLIDEKGSYAGQAATFSRWTPLPPKEETSPQEETQVKSVRIGVAVVQDGDQVLVGIRHPDQVLPGLHEFPGGKCFDGESAEECALRECQEETGLKVVIDHLLFQTTHDYPHGRVELHFFACSPAEKTSPLLGNFQWFPRSALNEMTFPEANKPVIERLLAATPE